MEEIDFHTHQYRTGRNIQILNVFAQDLSVTPDSLFSAGLHPWHIGKVNSEECFQAIERAAQLKNMIAIGECGLDRSISTDFALQEFDFKKQIHIAETNHKPLIIHCVRAYSDLIRLKKESGSTIPWIIHAYHGNGETTVSLIKHKFYFSVGEQVLKDKLKHQILRTIPFERIFLETDDRKISIEEIYLLAAQILKIDVQILTQTICRNFETLFGRTE